MTTLIDEDPADPSVHEPRVTNAPETVWLVYGDLERDATHSECCASGEVTWCEDAQFPADVRYLRADLLYHEARQIAAEEVAAERRQRELAFAELLKEQAEHARARYALRELMQALDAGGSLSIAEAMTAADAVLAPNV